MMENVKDINIMEINVKVNARVLVIFVVFVLEMILVKNVQMESILVKSAKKYVINALNLYVIFIISVMLPVGTVVCGEVDEYCSAMQRSEVDADSSPVFP